MQAGQQQQSSLATSWSPSLSKFWAELVRIRWFDFVTVLINDLMASVGSAVAVQTTIS